MMFKRSRSNKAQMTGEYALTLFLVVGVITAMTIYVRRALQAQLYDARRYMFNTVKTAPHIGKLNLYYEPYYIQSNSLVDQSINEKEETRGGGQTGRFRRVFDDTTTVQTDSTQLPPANAD